ncbi:methyl-accepting chemotaxis protein [Leeia speluncae]|uniref:methyl-accepting chemotaxis protein n=1 Tax=Leeia speluncae TaxID=2884804 RepID=UPI0025463A25|nr:methyl-accepting chemotaxis protein [Leeia speluncae]
MSFSNLKIGTRLGFSFVIVLAMLAGLGVFSLTQLSSLNGDANEIGKNWLPSVEASSTVNGELYRMRQREYRLVVEKNSASAQKALKESNTGVEVAMANYEKLITEPEEKATYAEAKKVYATHLQNQGSLVDALSAGQQEQAEAIISGEMRTNFTNLTLLFNKLVKINHDGSVKSVASADEVFNQSTKLVIAVIIIALAIGTLLAILITRSITKPLAKAVEVANAVSHGQLDVQVRASGKDETATLLRSMQSMIATLQQFVAAQEEMKSQHDQGAISFRIDSRRFEGRFAAMANLVNELVAAHIAVKMRIVDVVTEYAKGNLSVDMDRLPGEKAKITTAIDGVKTSLQQVNAQIKELVTAANNGNFTARGDAAKYQYEFREMVEGLNSLMSTSDKGLTEVGRVLKALAQGDLTQRIDGDYRGTFKQLKDDSNETAEKLSEIVTQIREATDTINTAAKEIAAGNQNLSQRTEQQAASLEETASSMEELTGTVKQNADNARQANQLARGASDIAVKGGEVVGQVVKTMDDINNASRKIVDIISVIDGIAFQTNILALNAAVEAARAGEQGRGFAVVASEVRTLAQRSAAAAKEIKGLINDSVEKADLGAKLVNEAGGTMDEVVTSVKRVTDIMSEIASASVEQSTGIEQVNTTITQMDDVTQQNAALVEEAAAAAESLEEQAQSLAMAVAAFRLSQSNGRFIGNQTNTTRAMPNAVVKRPSAPSAASSIPKLSKAELEGDWEEF